MCTRFHIKFNFYVFLLHIFKLCGKIISGSGSRVPDNAKGSESERSHLMWTATFHSSVSSQESMWAVLCLFIALPRLRVSGASVELCPVTVHPQAAVNLRQPGSSLGDFPHLHNGDEGSPPYDADTLSPLATTNDTSKFQRVLPNVAVCCSFLWGNGLLRRFPYINRQHDTSVYFICAFIYTDSIFIHIITQNNCCNMKQPTTIPNDKAFQFTVEPQTVVTYSQSPHIKKQWSRISTSQAKYDNRTRHDRGGGMSTPPIRNVLRMNQKIE